MKKSILIILIILTFFLVISNKKIFHSYQTEKFIIGSKTLIVQIADTKKERERGLSARKNLPQDQGMLFVFDQPGQYGFWMKDMNFPIDIIWLDNSKKIIGTVKNLQPDSYPEIFVSPKETRYVLEVNSGLNLGI